MAAKTVALDAEAYDLLRRQKRGQETFSETVKRLAGPKPSLLDFAGAWRAVPEKELAEVRHFLAEGRRRDRERMSRAKA